MKNFLLAFFLFTVAVRVYGSATVTVQNVSGQDLYYYYEEWPNDYAEHTSRTGLILKDASATATDLSGYKADGSSGTFGGAPITSVSYHVWTTDGSSVQIYEGEFSLPLTTDGTGETLTIPLNHGLTNETPCLTNLTFSVKNGDTVAHGYFLTYLSTIDSAGNAQFLTGVDDVLPGGTGVMHLNNLSCSNAVDIGVRQENPGGQFTALSDGMGGSLDYLSGSTPVITAPPTTSSGGTPSPAPNPNPPPSVSTPTTQYNPTNSQVSGTNSPILFTGTNNAQEGLDALYVAVVAAGTQAHEDSESEQKIIGNGDTNIVAAISNATFSLDSHLNGLTNITGDGTNQFALTNYANETTLEGISNLLAGRTNSFDTNVANAQVAADAVQGRTEGASESNTLAGALSGLNPPGDSDAYGSALSGWTISVPFGAGYTIDLNPFDKPWVVSLAAFMRSFLKWGMTISMVIFCSTRFLNALQAAGANRQATSEGIAGAIPVVGGIVSLGIAVILSLTLLGLISVALALLSHYSTEFNLNPFTDISGVEQAVWMADQFLPLNLIISAPLATLSFQYTLAGAVAFNQAVARFLPG